MFMVLKKKKLSRYITVIFLFIGCCLGITGLNFNSISENKVKVHTKVESNELEDGEIIAVSSDDNFFVKSHNDKELVRSKTTELLRSVIDNDNSSQSAKSDAEQKIINIANEINLESKIESLLVAKGFTYNIVFISDGLTTVTVKSDSISSDGAAKINDIVSGITGNNNIKIVEVN